MGHLQLSITYSRTLREAPTLVFRPRPQDQLLAIPHLGYSSAQYKLGLGRFMAHDPLRPIENRIQTMTPDEVRHLEMIQAVIDRLANNSFLVKGWALTLASATYAFSVQTSEGSIAVVGMFGVVAFWTLDAYYLRSERLFRALYDSVRFNRSHTHPYSMDVSEFSSDVASHPRLALTTTQVGIHAPLLVLGGTILLLTILQNSR